jgi:hypothetical protein
MHRAANPLFILLLPPPPENGAGAPPNDSVFSSTTIDSSGKPSRDILAQDPGAKDEVQRRAEVAEQDCKVSFPSPIVVQGRTRMLLRVLSFARMVRKGEEFSEGTLVRAHVFFLLD